MLPKQMTSPEDAAKPEVLLEVDGSRSASAAWWRWTT